MTTATMTSIGDKLKKARESKSLTIDQVQKQTRIHSTVLVALEEGRCDKMLTPTYVKSFLKKYAEHLGFDAREVMNDYLEVHPEAKPQEHLSPKQPPAGAEAASFDIRELARKGVPVLLVAVAVCLTVILAANVVRFLGGRTSGRAVVAVRSQEVKTKKPRMEKTAPPKPAAPAKENSPAESAAAKVAQQRPQAAKNEPLTLTLKAKRDVFVMANIDGEIAFKRLLPKGTVESLKADRSINLYIARGEAVELTLNGKILRSFGRGVVKDLEITRKGVRVK